MMKDLIVEDWTEDEFYNLVDELFVILNTAITISVSEQGKECDRRIDEATGFFMKQIFHSYTILQIVKPQYYPELKFLSSGGVFHDFSSAAIVVRAMLETYINMVYITVLPISVEEFDFKKDLWDLHALCERRKIGELIGSKHPKLTENEQKITDFINKIKSSSFYLSLIPIEKQSIDDRLKNNAENYIKWSKETTITKATLSGIHQNHSEYLYKITSAYVHSESFSIMQFLGLSDPIEPMRLTHTYLRYANMLLATTIRKYSEIVDISQYLSDRGLINLIDDYIWLSQQDLSIT